MKRPDSYVFTNEFNHFKILTRETLTKALNLVTRRVSEEILSQPNIAGLGSPYRRGREAITALQGEMQGMYTNVQREPNYGLGKTLDGPDFKITGEGQFKEATHLEAKNPVHSTHKKSLGQRSSVAKQGKKIGEKLEFQRDVWSSPAKMNKYHKNSWNPEAGWPEKPENVLVVVDLLDTTNESSAMSGYIIKGANKYNKIDTNSTDATNSINNLVFMNYNGDIN